MKGFDPLQTLITVY